MSENPTEFQANPDMLELLTSMGISENEAREALFCTGNSSADAAIDYIFNSEPSGSSVPSGDAGPSKPPQKVREDDDQPEYKMTFIVNTSLKMGIGKIAAQVGHACLGLYRKILSDSKMKPLLNQWEEIGEKKIVLKGNSPEHLLDLYEQALAANIPSYLVRDAGHTQIPSGSITVLSLFGLEVDMDQISGGLSLL